MVESRFVPLGLGWQRDLPDPRDDTPEYPQVRELLDRLPLQECVLPSRVDLRCDVEGFMLPPPEDQGTINLRVGHCCGSQTPDVLDSVRRFLAAGYPVAFGIPVPRGLTRCPEIPYRPHFESYHGGQ